MRRLFIYFYILIIATVSCTSSRMSITSVNQKSYQTNTQRISKDLSLSYIEEGNGEQTLVFIHGLGSDKKAWVKNIDALKGRYRCIAVDLPGYGSSSSGDYAYDMSFFSETIMSFLKKKRIKKPILIGHSMGGQVVLHTLIHQKEIADQAVLIAPAGIEEFTEQEAAWLKMVYTPKVVERANDDQIAANLRLNFSTYPSDAEFMIEERIQLKLSPNFEVYTRMIPKCVAGMLDQPVAGQFGEIEAEVLLLFGSDDQLIPNQYLHKDLTTSSVAVNGAGAIPKSQLEIWQNCGHMLQWECAEATNRAIDSFISKD